MSGLARRTPPGRPAARSSRGMALLLVLWVLALIAGLALILSREARQSLRQAAATVALAQARAAADAGVWIALRAVLAGAPGPAWPTDGTPRALGFAGFRIRLTLQDEAGKADLNAAPLSVLAAAGRAAGLAPAAARRLGREIERHRRFASVADLLALPGVSPTLLSRLRRFVTVHSGDPLIDPRVAPAALLAALPGLNPVLARSYLARRDGPDPLPARILGVTAPLAAPGPLAALTIRAVATRGGIRFDRVALIVLTPGADWPYRVASWRQGGLLRP
ncbi:MAG: hypothetical protein ACP5NP_02120 [Acetobacteraceae bacterium]